MATDADTLSFTLATSTAPTDITQPTCVPKSAPPSPCYHPEDMNAKWETQIHPPTSSWTLCGDNAIKFSSSGTGMDSLEAAVSSPSKSGCFNDGGLLYQIQAERECRQGPGKAVEEICQRSLKHFPCPGLVFPTPALDFDFRIAVRLNQEPVHVDSGNAKDIATVAAGVWSGSFGHGRVIAGGYDLGQVHNSKPMRLVEGAFVIQTSDEHPAVIEVRTRGSVSGPSDTLDTLLSPCIPKDIDPRHYGFRMFATLKSSDRRYAEIVNCELWVASGAWRGEHLIIDAYRVT